MTDELAGTGAGDTPGAAVLREIEASLNIFALANGLDLIRNPGGAHARILEWYRDGMERRIYVMPSAASPGGALDVEVGAVARKDGGKTELRQAFRAAVAPGELKAALPEAIEAANGVARADVERDGSPP
jgi:hypothetical protein